jgi:lipopolysaccharide export LptBFGC system permease protein LptF
MELVAIQAGGIRLSRIVLPVLATALILSLASAILHETLILRADQIWHARIHESRDEIDFGRQAFWYHKGATITSITKADAATRTLFGVEIFERGVDGSIARVIRAERVRIQEDGLWRVPVARVWTFDPSKPVAAPRLSEESNLEIDLAVVEGDALLGAEPRLLPLPALARYLAVQEDLSASNHRRLTNRLHERLSQPWLAVIFAFIALPFALGVDQTGRFIRPGLGAASVVGLFYLLRSAGTTLAQQEFFPVGWAPWLAMGLITVATAWSLRGRSL